MTPIVKWSSLSLFKLAWPASTIYEFFTLLWFLFHSLERSIFFILTNCEQLEIINYVDNKLFHEWACISSKYNLWILDTIFVLHEHLTNLVLHELTLNISECCIIEKLVRVPLNLFIIFILGTEVTVRCPKSVYFLQFMLEVQLGIV